MKFSEFRKESLRRISSPEQLNDYLHVTSPMGRVILLAVILLISGMLIWLNTVTVESYAAGIAEVRSGVLTLVFEDKNQAENVEPGMDVVVGDKRMSVLSVGYDNVGKVFAVTDTNLPDGSYEARVRYKNTQILELLFN